MNVLTYILVAFLVGLGAGAYTGYDYRDGKVAAEVSKAQKRTLERASQDADAATKLALAAAKREADARLAARTSRLKGEIDAAKKARPECARDAESVSLLNDAIRAASSGEGAAPGVPAKVRPATDAGGRLGDERSPVGIRLGGLGGFLSPAPR